MVKLLCIRGPLTGLSLPLTGDEVTIGRGSECSLVLPDSTVSRVHARIRRHRMGWLLDDCRSAHGTFLNGREVGESFPLSPDDEIRIGHTILLFNTASGMHHASFTEGFVYTSAPPPRRAAEPVAVLDAVPEEEQTSPVRDTNALLAGLLDGPEVPYGEAAARMIRRIAAYFRAEMAVLMLEDHGTGELRAAALAGSAGRTALLCPDTLRRAFQRRQALLLSGRPLPAKHPVPGAPAPPPHRSLLVAPLVAGPSCLGVLSIQRGEPDAYSTKDLHLARALGCLAGAYLEARRVGELASRAVTMEGMPLLVGDSLAAAKLRDRLLALAKEKAVLLQGERGSDTAAVARELHRLQAAGNASVPLMTVRYKGESEPLFAAELFGQERGAFDNATPLRQGLLELAAGGILFIEELTALPAGVQERLLAALRHGGFSRVGGTHLQPTGARIVAATAHPPADSVREGRLLRELHERLLDCTAEVPPLRARREDIPVLAQHHLRLAAARHSVPVPELDRGTVAALSGRDWPGNERELALEMEQLVLRGQPEDMPTRLDMPAPPG